MMGSLKWPKASRCGAGRRLSLTRVTDEVKMAVEQETDVKILHARAGRPLVEP